MSDFVPGWRELRRFDVVPFIHEMARRHPELARPVVWIDFVAMAKRDGIIVLVTDLTRPARPIRNEGCVCIQLRDTLNRSERTRCGMLGLCHAWRDDPGRSFYHAEEEGVRSPSEDLADLFAWVVTSPARVYQPGLREEDF